MGWRPAGSLVATPVAPTGEACRSLGRASRRSYRLGLPRRCRGSRRSHRSRDGGGRVPRPSRSPALKPSPSRGGLGWGWGGGLPDRWSRLPSLPQVRRAAAWVAPPGAPTGWACRVGVAAHAAPSNNMSRVCSLPFKGRAGVGMGLRIDRPRAAGLESRQVLNTPSFARRYTAPDRQAVFLCPLFPRVRVRRASFTCGRVSAAMQDP